MDKLTESQVEYAEKIAKAAKAAGVPPRLAVAIAYQESGLNPNAKDGGAGEIGIMQVRQSTGKMLGSSEKDLRDPDKNIATGIRYLKQALDATKGDQKLATIGYNAGIDSKFFSGGDLPASTQDYIRSVNGYGAFEGEAPGKKKEQDSEMVVVPAKPIDDASSAPERARIKREENDQETRMAQYIGAGAGAGVSATGIAGLGLEAGARRVGAGFTAGRQGGGWPSAKVSPITTAPAAPLGGVAPAAGGVAPAAGGLPPVARPPVMGVADAGRMAQGQTGTMPYNYAKSAGLPDIEALHATDMTRNAGGVHDLVNKRSAALERLKQMGFGNFSEDPRFGGVMTPDEGVGGVKKSFVPVPAIPPSPELPAGQAPGLRQLPPTQSIPNPIPKATSGLDAVTNMFKGMIRSPVGQAFGTVVKYGSPPLALADAAGQGAQLAQELRLPSNDIDISKAILHALRATGSFASAFPPTRRVGVPLTVAAMLGQQAIDPANQEALGRKFDAVQAADIPPSNPMGDYFGN